MRAFVVGGGERALALARSLREEGHAVRMVVEAGDAAAEAAARDAGCEPWTGTPDRIGTLRNGLDGVTLLLWLQADAGAPEIHGSRLKMMLEKTTDTTVRGVVYEAGGPFEAAGLAEMRFARETNEIPFEAVATDRDDRAAWLRAMRDAIDRLLAVDRIT